MTAPAGAGRSCGSCGATIAQGREKIFRRPPVEWIRERMGELHTVLERRTPGEWRMDGGADGQTEVSGSRVVWGG